MAFEWDDRKAAANLAKHNVSFQDVTLVFDDVHAIHIVDHSLDYGEERFICIGMANGIIFYVAYTERRDVVRLISARKATRLEQRAYDRERQG